MPKLFALRFDADAAHGIKLLVDRGRAATMWRAPGHTFISAGEMLRLALLLILTFARNWQGNGGLGGDRGVYA